MNQFLRPKAENPGLCDPQRSPKARSGGLVHPVHVPPISPGGASSTCHLDKDGGQCSKRVLLTTTRIHPKYRSAKSPKIGHAKETEHSRAQPSTDPKSQTPKKNRTGGPGKSFFSSCVIKCDKYFTSATCFSASPNCSPHAFPTPLAWPWW